MHQNTDSPKIGHIPSPVIWAKRLARAGQAAPVVAWSLCMTIAATMVIAPSAPVRAANMVPQDEPAGPVNKLSTAEAAAGWHLLWDGNTTQGWRGARSEHFPDHGWFIRDGAFGVEASGGRESTNGGDIVTTRVYRDFELKLEFRIANGANSGIKYFVDPELTRKEGSAIGLEFQLLDDANNQERVLGVAGNHRVGSLYDLIAAENLSSPGSPKPVPTVGQWSRARILSRGSHVEHWLDGVKVVEYERGSQMFRALVTHSKWNDMKGYGLAVSGPILLQDHGDEVWFRSIKLRELGSAATP